jgi:hypothetical protein
VATQVLPTKHQIPLEERKNPKRGHELKKKINGNTMGSMLGGTEQ